jgi:hypothetical protein
MVNQKQSKQKGKNTPQSGKEKKIKQKEDFLDRINNGLSKRDNVIFIILFFCNIIFAFLLFNFKVHEGGDDSAYILRAFRFVNDLQFPSFQGPLYPIVLSLFVWIFGINITLLKALSTVFILVHLFYFFKAYRNNVPSLLLVFSMIIISINAYILTYASLTYSETFFMMLQAIMLFYFFKYFISSTPSGDLRESYGQYLILGLLIFLMGITRTIGYAALGVVVFFFIVEKQWRSIAPSILSFGVFYGLLHLIKMYAFDTKNIQFNNQLDRLLLKDPYKVAEGKEDIVGFFERLIGNSNLYISKHLYRFMGFRPDSATDTMPVLTVLTILIFIVGLVIFFRKNKYLFFTGLYTFAMSGITFIMLQTRWDQDRLILIYFPLILLFLTATVYYIGKIKKLNLVKVSLLLLMVTLFFTTLNTTTQKIKNHQDELVNNLHGNKLYGFTPDWVNYIKMSEYAAKNVPDSVNIACRKASISFIYGKRHFNGISRVTSQNGEELLQELKDKNVRYVIMASLRRYPNQKTEHTINTIQRYLYYIQKKYPHVIQQVHKIGADEEAYLFKLNY